jgi:transposase-like protein
VVKKLSYQCYYCHSENIVDAWDFKTAVDLETTERVYCKDCKRNFSSANLNARYKQILQEHVRDSMREPKNGS